LPASLVRSSCSVSVPATAERTTRPPHAYRALAEAKEGLDARNRKLAEAEAALAEVKEGLDARGRKLAKTEAELAAAKEALGARDRRLTQVQESLTTALAEIGVLRDDVLMSAHHGPVSEEACGGPRSADARPGGVIIAAPVPAPCGKRRAEVVKDIIDLCSSDEEEPEGSRRVSRKTKAAASEYHPNRLMRPGTSTDPVLIIEASIFPQLPTQIQVRMNLWNPVFMIF
jgi:hypothetical protein